MSPFSVLFFFKWFSNTTECFIETWSCCLCTLCFKCLHCVHCIKWCSTHRDRTNMCTEKWFLSPCGRMPQIEVCEIWNEAQRRLTPFTEYLEAPNPQMLSRVCCALLFAKTKSRLWIVTLISLSVCYFPANEVTLLPGCLCGTTSLENVHPEKE